MGLVIYMIKHNTILTMFMFFRSYETMLEPLKWLATVNIFKYGSEILVANEYKGLKFECPPGDYCKTRNVRRY